jgi:membrane protease YdiL (CAAX protease family)
MSVLWAAALSGLMFAAAHLDKWNLVALWTVGIGLGLLFYRTRSLWPNMIAHTTFNAFTLVLIYVFPQFAK